MSDDLVARLAAIERDGGDGVLALPGGGELALSSLDKPFFPEPGYTKGDLFRHYARVAPRILPRLADRPLVLRRHPDGVGGKSFFQQKAPAAPPAGVRVETIRDAAGRPARRLVGGDLATLLYLVQLGVISIDPWNARVGSLDRVDPVILDLDPGPRVPFRRVVEVARAVHREVERRSLDAELKTSGKRGLHVLLPFPGGIPADDALGLAEELAEAVVAAEPRLATVERAVAARPRGTVYVDWLQNVVGKPVAAAWSVRATPEATVSTPLAWAELTDALDPRAFTLERVAPARASPQARP